MKKIMSLLLCVSLASLCYAAPPPGDAVKKATVMVAPKYVTVQQVYLSQVGVRELTGHNDGAEVENYLSAVHLGKGYPWCAAFVRWCYDRAGVRTSINGSSGSCYNAANVVYRQGHFLQPPRAGDAIVFYFPSLGRIGHTGFYDSQLNARVYRSCEGNTGDGKGIVRDGGGVYIRYRSYKATYGITRWTA